MYIDQYNYNTAQTFGGQYKYEVEAYQRPTTRLLRSLLEGLGSRDYMSRYEIKVLWMFVCLRYYG